MNSGLTPTAPYSNSDKAFLLSSPSFVSMWQVERSCSAGGVNGKAVVSMVPRLLEMPKDVWKSVNGGQEELLSCKQHTLLQSLSDIIYPRGHGPLFPRRKPTGTKLGKALRRERLLLHDQATERNMSGSSPVWHRDCEELSVMDLRSTSEDRTMTGVPGHSMYIRDGLSGGKDGCLEVSLYFKLINQSYSWHLTQPILLVTAIYLHLSEFRTDVLNFSVDRYSFLKHSSAFCSKIQILPR
ncbi:hypothetical protein CB1_000316012 [Camelus ferus]|nr:hypothetical protein CB1_000316012 [Camelus ferus]